MPNRSAALAMILLFSLTIAAASQVPQQAIEAVYDPVERTFEGRLDVTLASSAQTVYFALLPNLARTPNPHVSDRLLDAHYPFGFESAGLTIDSVQLVQSPSTQALSFRLLALPPTLQTYELDETVLAVDLPREMDRPTLRIDFRTEIPRTSLGDEGITDGVLTWRFGWYPLLLDAQGELVEDEGVIGYGRADRFPLVFPATALRAVVSAPPEMVFLTGADRVESKGADEDSKVLSTHHATFDSPTRSFGITLGTGYELYRLDGPTPIEVAYFEGHEAAARLFATYAREIIGRYESRFGAYPREKLTIVENPNSRGTAFAADGILWLSQRLFTHRNVPLAGIANRFVEYILAHEIAHQWFGLGTGVDLDAEAWLSEGLAQYASISDYEFRHGSNGGNLFEIASRGLLEEMLDRQFGFYNLREHQVELPYLFALWSGFDEAIVKPTSEVDYANADVVRLYDKGYLVARAIAAEAGPDTFDRALRVAYEETQGRRLTVSALQEYVEEEAGRSFDRFFSAWLYGDVSVDYAAEIESARKTAGGYETTVTVTRAGGVPQPVDVEVTLSSGATDRKTWDADDTETRLVFRTPSPVRRASIDPDHRLPDRNRLNNNDPVRIVTAINRAALPLDAYVLSPNPSTGGFTFGFLDRFHIAVGERTASMTVREGRHHRYSASASLKKDGMTGRISYTYTTYHQPETGSAATYWEPDVDLTIRARRLFSGDVPIWVLGLSATDFPSIGTSGATSVAVDVTQGGATRLTLSAFDEVRLLPQLYLQGIGTLGFSVGELQRPLRFSFGELRTARLGRTPNKLTGALALDLTTSSDPYNLINLAMVDRNTTRLYLAGGLGWTSLQDFSTTNPYLEAGVEQVIQMSTLGGLLPFAVRIGIATPVMGTGLTAIYVDLSL